MSFYTLAVLGEVTDSEREQLTVTLAKMLTPFDLQIGQEVLLLTSADIDRRDKHVAFAAAYFRGKGHADEDLARVLIASSAAVIPVVSESGSFTEDVPEFLGQANGYQINHSDDPEMCRLASAMLECIGLLQRQRRVFVSYRRIESRAAAVQLHDELSAHGFDVFLDTHDIQPGEPFQEVLWHRLCDSDVMVMLDTETYFERKWTRQELGRARATGIHVLRVVWPDHKPNPQTDLAETIYLENHELLAKDGPIVEATIAQIIAGVESLRSRSVAARYMALVGKLRVEAAAIGAEVESVGAYHAMTVRLPQGKRIYAYPIVGVPTAELFNDVAVKAGIAGQGVNAVLIYDHIGIRHSWVSHLKWLDDNISVVRAIKVREASWALPEFE